MLGYNDIELKQTRFYQDVFTEGLQEGIDEGIHEGIQKGEAKVILRQLNRRFSNLHPNTIIQIQQLSSDQLEALADKVFDFTTQNDLDVWLDKI